MNQSNIPQGYILVLTVLILSISVILLTHIINKTITFTHFAHIASDREQAKLLAESGIDIALAEFTLVSTDTKNIINNQLTAQLPFLNTWQSFTLTRDFDGIDGICKLYISCEEGKIDINSLYDFEKKRWRKEEPKISPFAKPGSVPPIYDAKKIITLLGEKLKSSFGGKNPVDILDHLFKSRKEPLEDLSLLLTAKDLPKQPTIFPDPSDSDKAIAISDIFTVFTNKKNIQPLMLSSGIIKALGFKSPQRSKDVLGFIKKIKPTMQWESSWHDTLAPWYGIEYTVIPPEIQSLFASKFEGKTFSVVSYGIVGTFTQKLCVVLQQQEGGLQGQQQPRYIIKRWYWL